MYPTPSCSLPRKWVKEGGQVVSRSVMLHSHMCVHTYTHKCKYTHKHTLWHCIYTIVYLHTPLQTLYIPLGHCVQCHSLSLNVPMLPVLFNGLVVWQAVMNAITHLFTQSPRGGPVLLNKLLPKGIKQVSCGVWMS